MPGTPLKATSRGVAFFIFYKNLLLHLLLHLLLQDATIKSNKGGMILCLKQVMLNSKEN